MGKQTTKKIPSTVSYIPIDPNAFPENYLISSRSMSESEAGENPPVLPYEGYNFMPTSYGYKSYFGTNAELDIEALPAQADDIFIIQTETFENILYALCDSGIWRKSATVEGNWEQIVVLELPTSGTKLEWSHCLIQNTLYCYRQANPSYYKLTSAGIQRTNSNPTVASGLVIEEEFPTGIDYPNELAAGTYAFGYASIAANGDVSPTASVFTFVTASGLVGEDIGALEILIPVIPDDKKWRLYVDFTLPDAVETSRFILDNIFPQTSNIGRLTEQFFFTADYLSEVIPLPADFNRLNPIYYSVPPNGFQSIVPTFLNMEGQMGLFKAGSRLGFWDSANAIATSSIDDFQDFKPAVKTLAGISTFQEVTGRIINILASGDGFVIYATKSIIYIERNVNSTLGFSPRVVVKSAGISFRKECCAGASDTMQFAITPIGLFQITNGAGQVIIPEVTDFLKESKEPVYLKIISGRYLFLEMLDANYANGLVTFKKAMTEDQKYEFINEYANGEPTLLEDVYEFIEGSIEYLPADPGSVRPKLEITYFNVDFAGDNIEQAYPNAVMPMPISAGYYAQEGLDTGLVPAAAVPVTVWNFKSNTIDYDFDFQPADYPVYRALLNEYDPSARMGALYNAYNIDPAIDNSYTEEFTSIQAAVTTQNAIWLNLDTKLYELMSAFDGRQNSIIQAFKTSETTEEYYFEFRGPGPGGPDGLGATIGPNIGAISPSPNPTVYADAKEGGVISSGWLSGRGKEQSPPILDSIIGSFDTAWGPTFFNGNGNTLEYIRRRSGITTVYVDVEIETVNESFEPYMPDPLRTDTGGGNYTLQYWNGSGVRKTFKKATATLKIVQGDTLQLEDSFNPIQKATIKLLGYEYTSNGEPQIILGEDFLIPFPDKFNTIAFPDIPPLVLPGTSFLLQKGGIGPVYPTIPSAYVYDMQLKKWGRFKEDYKLLLDYSPINNTSVDVVDFETFGMQAGILSVDGKVKIFDKNPVDSMIRYGKIGYEREGFTSAEEIRVSFRSPSTGIMFTESSLDGTLIDSLLDRSNTYTNAIQHVIYPSTSARWHTFGFKGNFDIKYLEYRGSYVGNR